MSHSLMRAPPTSLSVYVPAAFPHMSFPPVISSPILGACPIALVAPDEGPPTRFRPDVPVCVVRCVCVMFGVFAYVQMGVSVS